jgi:hypothetical protein
LVPAGGYRRVTALNNGGSTNNIDYWSFALCPTLTQGSHTIAVFVALQSGSPANVSGDASSVLQGELTTVILKQ